MFYLISNVNLMRKETGSRFVAQAALQRLFSDAIPLLNGTGALACSVSGLLRFRPGPVHPSLDNLVFPGSPRSTISIPNLARTSDRHSPLQLRTPELTQSTSLSLPVAWITGARHCTRRETGGFGRTLKLPEDCAINFQV